MIRYLIFTDASFDPVMKIGVVAIKVIDNTPNEEKIYSFNNDELKNTQLELYGIDLCIELFNYNDKTVIFTDCQASSSKVLPPNFQIVKIKAHKKKSDCDDIELKFREVDILSRKILKRRRLSYESVNSIHK